MTSDLRLLKDVTIKDYYAIEIGHDALDWLTTKASSVFDLKYGFYQVELHPDSKACTAIGTILWLLQLTRLPQGLKNSSGTFKRVMNMIIANWKGRAVLAFMEDTRIGPETEEKHLESLLVCWTYSKSRV